MNFKHLLIFAGILGAFTSCNDVDTDTKSTQGFTNCYAIITDTQTGEVSVSQPVTSALFLNWTQQTAEASFSGLLIGGYTYPQMTLLDLKWNSTSNGLWGKMTNQPTVVLSTGTTASVEDFEYQWSDRLDMPNLEPGNYDPAFIYSFTLDNRYEVVGSRTPFSFWGTTTASAEGVNPFTSEVNNILVNPDFKNMTMTVLVNGAQFASGMPALNICLEGIPMQMGDGGKSFTFSADNLIPTIAGTPYPNYPCSNIHGTLDPSEGMEFSFDCNVRNAMIYTVTTSPTVFGYRTIQ